MCGGWVMKVYAAWLDPDDNPVPSLFWTLDLAKRFVEADFIEGIEGCLRETESDWGKDEEAAAKWRAWLAAPDFAWKYKELSDEWVADGYRAVTALEVQGSPLFALAQCAED